MMGKNKNQDLLIIGAGGHGKVVADIAENMGCYRSIVFADADENIKSCMGYEVIREQDLEESFLQERDIIVAVGNSVTREKICKKMLAKGLFLPTLIHPSATMAESASIGCGSVVMAGAVINPGAVIGCACIINTASSIDHDCRVGNYCHISVGAHLAGTVTIGSHTWVGIGACVSNNLTVCEQCTIGAGAVVVKNIATPGIYVGIPAKGQ